MTKDEIEEFIDLAAEVDKTADIVEKAGKKIKKILKRLKAFDDENEKLYLEQARENILNAAWSLGEAERVLCYVEFPEEEEKGQKDEQIGD